LGAVRLYMSMSLDGFVADRRGDSAVLYPDIRNQVVGGADAAQQLLNADLLDQIQISLMPVLIGEGLRLVEHIGSEKRQHEKIKVIDSPGRTDIRYRVAS
jgi:dihydrofolate reductase